MVEYLGGETLEEASAVYLSRCDLLSHRHPGIKRPEELDHFLEHGLDVGRSLWDRRTVLAHLDLEYVNFDFPAEPTTSFGRSRRRQRAEHGVRLVLENMLSHLLLGREMDLHWFLKTLAPWRPGFCLDTSHAHLAGNLDEPERSGGVHRPRPEA